MLRDNGKPSIHFLIESSKRADSSPPRIDDLVAELSKLPPEIVHSVLDDLPLEAILDLAQHHHHDGEVAEREAYSGLPNDEARKQASYFDHCVLTHLRLKSVFPELSEFVRLSSIWSIYSTVCCSRETYNREHHYLPSWHMLFLNPLSDKIRAGLGISTSCLRNPPTSNQIANELIDSIYSIVQRFHEELQTLALYTDKPLPFSRDWYRSLKDFGNLEIPWTNVIEAATRFNDLRCEQLLDIARLYETYPSLLKKAADPAQTPRKNVKHITDRLRGNAHRIKKSNPAHCFDYLRQDFGQELFPIVPFDSLLDLFVNTLERYPIRSINAPVSSSDTPVTRVGKDIDALELQLARTSLTTSASASEAVYPTQIREAIEIAILGLPYVYVPFQPLSLDIAPKVPRTKYTPYSAKSYRSMSPNVQGCFSSPYHAHLKEVYAEDKLEKTLKNRMARPYDERELDWLEAFLKACDFMMKLK